jgi:hypothetical protein
MRILILLCCVPFLIWPILWISNLAGARLAAAWGRALGWLTLQRRCAWCARHVAGNPFAGRVTHGMCPACAEEWMPEGTNDFNHGTDCAPASTYPHRPTTPAASSPVSSI